MTAALATDRIVHPAGIRRISPRLAATLFSALAFVTLGAGLAAATQTHLAAPVAKPAAFVLEEGQHAVATGRPAHRLCRSPIRYFGTAEPRQLPDCKRIDG